VSDAFTQQNSFALGLGLTNECNLACSFCYRDPNRVDRLTLDQVRNVVNTLPIQSINLGTGENGMHPGFLTILDFLRAQPIKLTITSNGHSVAMLDDEHVRAFHDVEFSLDYPTEEEQDRQRGSGNWRLIHEQAGRCRSLGVPVTIVAVMMKTNYLKLADVARIAKRYEAPLRVNVYQSVRTDSYALTYEEYWEGFRRLLAETDVIAIGETLVRAMAGLSAPEQPCGCGRSTVRVTPRGTIQPCVYWPGEGGPLAVLLESGAEIVKTDPFVKVRTVPDSCEACEFRNVCRGGCAGRRMLQDRIEEPDYYCPIIRGHRPQLEISMAPLRDLPKVGSACTTVVIARD
jgi:radical SAM protein with 4Fe4S-binding SPASM domain